MVWMNQPSLQQKVSAAIYVLSMRPNLPGVQTTNTLMWPYRQRLAEGVVDRAPAWAALLPPYGDDDVRRQAAKLLTSVCTALLEDVHQPRLSQIWTDQAAYLSFALDVEPPGETCRSQAAAAHHQD